MITKEAFNKHVRILEGYDVMAEDAYRYRLRCGLHMGKEQTFCEGACRTRKEVKRLIAPALSIFFDAINRDYPHVADSDLRPLEIPKGITAHEVPEW